MSRLSIYETRWTDLVFENKNQEYGAYQLRKENVKNSLSALFVGLLLVASFGAIPTILNHFKADSAPVITPDIEDHPPLVVTTVDLRKLPDEAPPAMTTEEAVKTIDKRQLINPIITTASQATTEVATNAENKFAGSENKAGTDSGASSIPSGTGGNGTEVIKSEVAPTIEIANTGMLDKMPEFPGGLEKFYKYVGSNFEKPEIDNVNSLRIFVAFVIEKDGSMTDIKVIKDPGYGLGREAIRVLKSLKTKWTPGIIGAKPVRTAYNLPITIQIE